MQLDLNCDLGEGCPLDGELMPLITSANVACGFHAGGPAEAAAALALAARHGVCAGAHPSFPDRESFGRREMARTEAQIREDCLYQVGAIAGLAAGLGRPLTHIKAHGALYNMACRDDAYARPLVEVAVILGLPLLGLPGSRLEAASAGRCRFIAEGFADRRYLPDASLVPRSQPDAFVHTPAEAVQQALWLVRERSVQSMCIHGDNPQAVAFVHELREALIREGIVIRAFA